MNLEDAKMQASIWWGNHGSAESIEGKGWIRYRVGLTHLPAALGGRVEERYGASWKSFEAAFADAVNKGHFPITGFEGDDALVDEA
jgi:hypothetical protein